MPDELLSLSDGEIIDRLGLLSVEIKKLEARESAMREELLSRGFEKGDGAYFQAVTVEAYIGWTLNRKQLEADKGEAFLRPYLKSKRVSASVRVTARSDVAAARMAAE